MKKEVCIEPDCSDYRGVQNTTRTGLPCQAWNVQAPHPHADWTADKRPEAGLDENYCRTAGWELAESIWCYTTNTTVEWDYCDPHGHIFNATDTY